MKTLRYFLLQMLLLCSIFSSQAKTAFVSHSIFSRLSEGDRPLFTLETNLESMAESRKTDKGFSGTIRNENGMFFQVDLKAKGRFRRKYGEIAPVKVKFAKKDLLVAGLDTFNEFKIIFPYTSNEAGEACVVREYLIYQMFERLSPFYVKARLATVQLKDKHSDNARTMTCLLLEDKEEMQARLGGILTDNFDNKETDLDADQFATVALFEYMIGNTDWDLHTTRNLRILKHPDHAKLLAIPYDFDFSGFVNAPYAIPSADLHMQNIRDRYFMASELPTETIQKAFRKISAAKNDLVACCQKSGLSDKAVKDMTGYLEGFFKGMEKYGDLPKGYRGAK